MFGHFDKRHLCALALGFDTTHNTQKEKYEDGKIVTTYVKLGWGSYVGSAAPYLLSEAVSERQQESHCQDPGTKPLSLFRLLVVLLEEKLFEECST